MKLSCDIIQEYKRFLPERYIKSNSFECHSGWNNVIVECLKILELEETETNNPKVQQIKEKFGTLRFYAIGLNNNSYSKITELEKSTADICEFTGLPGILHVIIHPRDNNSGQMGWIKTVNIDYAKSYNDGGKICIPYSESSFFKVRQINALKNLYREDDSS